MLRLEELDQRRAGGLEVTLLWSPESAQLAVLVVDQLARRTFAVEVAPAEARDAFEHPYAYLRRRPPLYLDPTPGLARAA